MSGAIVNLRLARKAKRRSDAADTAAANRAKFGESRAEREIKTLDRFRLARHLDGHRLSDEPAGDVGDGTR